ncbi:MAG: glycosyltransferase family 4 protein [Rhodobacterales bacterium]
MNILLLSRYSRLGASSRLRTMQYLPVLAREGLNVQVASFFDDAYLQALYSRQKRHGSTTGYMLERVQQIRRSPAPDLIWLEKEALPWVPWLVERAVLPRGVPIVSDYDDAIFHRYDRHRRGVVRVLLGGKIGKLMAASGLVLAGNPYLAEHALASGAKWVEIVPTVVDLDAYLVAVRTTERQPSVGWIGTPQTWAELARPIHAVLLPALVKRGALFRAVGAALTAEDGERLEIRPWSEATEVAAIQQIDIGVMPLPDTPWARGKCGYKLIQYMACGIPVVASPVGVNSDIVEHGVNGFLARTDAEWRDAVETLLSDPDLRMRMGAAGRRKVEERYSLQVWGLRMAEMLRNVVS